jgi:hypothetical protein
MANKISHEPLPLPNMKLQTALLRRAVANAKKTSTGKSSKHDPAYQKFKTFCKKMDEGVFVDFRKECETERLRVFTLMESTRHGYMATANEIIKPLRKEVSEYDELIKELVENRNLVDAQITKIVREHGIKWQNEEKTLNTGLNQNLESIAKKYKGVIDESLRKELPEYCG